MTVETIKKANIGGIMVTVLNKNEESYLWNTVYGRDN